MYIANPIGFGFFIGAVSTIVLEIVALIIWAAGESKGGKNK